jgi:hypothetical protein
MVRSTAGSIPWRILLNITAALLLCAQNILLSLSSQHELPQTSSSLSPSQVLNCKRDGNDCVPAIPYKGDIPTEEHGKTKNERIPIFYNLFVNNETDAPRVRDLVAEQLSYIRPETNHPIYYNSIGYFMKIPNATLLKHHETGSEAITLFSLWSYCKKHKNDKVIYMHSKGSFTHSKENDKLRRFLTRGVFSDECRNMPSTCNVCSSRFSPLPHPHTSGNMFLARCEYIRELVDPNRIRNKMGFIDRSRDERPWCKGRERFSLEHWCYTHPSNKVRLFEEIVIAQVGLHT